MRRWRRGARTPAARNVTNLAIGFMVGINGPVSLPPPGRTDSPPSATSARTIDPGATRPISTMAASGWPQNGALQLARPELRDWSRASTTKPGRPHQPEFEKALPSSRLLMRRCNTVICWSKIVASDSAASGRYAITASMRFTNSGENFRRTSCMPMLFSFASEPRSQRKRSLKSEVGMNFFTHRARSQVAGEKNQRALEVHGGVVA